MVMIESLNYQKWKKIPSFNQHYKGYISEKSTSFLEPQILISCAKRSSHSEFGNGSTIGWGAMAY